MDEGEEDEADAFDADDDVAVFLDADDVAGVAGEVTACYAYELVFLEILFSEYFATSFVVGCE